MTSNLYSHRAWLEYYESKAAEVPYHIKINPQSFQSTMLSISRAALDSRAQQLRASDSYTFKKLQTAAAGIIPLMKIGVSLGVFDTFIDEALLAFGLSDTPGLEDLARQLKATSSGRDNIPMDILITFARLGKDELLAHFGAHAASETAHFFPGIGQLTSMGTGYVMQRKRLIKIIERARIQAEKVHSNILIPVVIHNNRVIPSRSKIAAKWHLTFTRIFFEIRRAFFDICMSLLALLTRHLLSVLYEYMDADVSPQQYFGFLATMLVTILLLRYVRAFRVMFASNVMGIVALYFYYQEFGQGMEAEGDQFIVACIATFTGFWFLRI